MIALPPYTLTGLKVANVPCVKFRVGTKVVATILGGVGGLDSPGNLEPVTPK